MTWLLCLHAQTRSAIRYIVMTERRFQHKLYLNGELDESEHQLLEQVRVAAVATHRLSCALLTAWCVRVPGRQRSNSTYKKVTRSAADELEAVDMRTAIHDCLLFKE